MKIKCLIEVDVSRTLAETMQRAGFTVKPDGTAMQVQIPNAPSVPRRKTKIEFSNVDSESSTKEKG